MNAGTRLRRRLSDVVTYGTSIIADVADASLASFVGDAILHDAVYYRLQCISEAVRSVTMLDPEIERRHPDIPWPAIRAIGNVLRHEYGDVDAVVIWETVALGRLEALIDVARTESARLGA